MSTKQRSRPERKRPAAKKPGAPPDGSNWIWLTKEMMESFAFQELVKHRPALVLVMRIVYEHLCHAGKNNGRLKVTFEDFRKWGIGRTQIGDAIAIAEALGFMKLVKRGRASWEDQRYPSEYALTWQPIGGELPTNDWKQAWSEETAKAKVDIAMKRRKAERLANAERNKARRLRTAPKKQFIAASTIQAKPEEAA